MIASLLRCLGLFSKDQRDEPVPVPAPVPSSVMDNLNLGVNVLGGKMSVLIPKNAKFPVKAEARYTTAKDYQTLCSTDVYEGDSAFTKDNIKLGGLKLDGFPPAPKGIVKVKLCFEVDANGTLKVSAVDTISCKLMNEITITSDQRRSAKVLNAKSKLRDYANAIMLTLGDARYEEKLKFADKKKILTLAKKQIEWLKRNEAAKIYEYESRQKELDALWNPIVTKLYQDATGVASPVLHKTKPAPPVLSKGKHDSCIHAPKASVGPSPSPNEFKLKACSPPPPKAGSVLDVVD